MLEGVFKISVTTIHYCLKRCIIRSMSSQLTADKPKHITYMTINYWLGDLDELVLWHF